MARLSRYLQKIFGSTAGTNQIGEFGSFAAGSIAYATNPDQVQQLSNYLQGWFAAIVGGSNPAIEDMNALCFLYAYQLAYIFQAGVPEWQIATSYYVGSIVSDGAGALYVSLTDDNIGNPVTDTTNWKGLNGPRRDVFIADGTWTAPDGVTQVRVTSSTFLYNFIAGASLSSFAMDATYNLYAWGLNSAGELGDGTVTDRSSPTLVVGLGRYRQVASSATHVLALQPSGAPYAWGSNQNGALGDLTNISRSSPVLIAGAHSFRMVAAGNHCSFGLDGTGALYGWGNNASGQIGDGTVTAKSTPTLVAGSRKFTSVYAGDDSCVMAIDDSQNLYAWGSNAQGEIGDGTIVAKSSPVLVVGGHKFVTAAASGISNYGITTNGDLYAWGDNTHGQLGTNDVLARSSPTLVVGGLKFRSVSANDSNVIAVTTGGDAYAWGLNSSGQVGDGTVTDRSSPVLVIGGQKWIQVGQGGVSTMGINSAGQLYTWGGNSSGQLGDGTTNSRSSPVLVASAFTYTPVVLESQTNSVVVPVVAGQTYNIKTFGLLALFDYVALYQDPYFTGAMPIKITLEY